MYQLSSDQKAFYYSNNKKIQLDIAIANKLLLKYPYLNVEPIKFSFGRKDPEEVCIVCQNGGYVSYSIDKEVSEIINKN